MFRLPVQVRDFLSRKDIKPDSSLGERLLQYFEFTVEGGESGGDAAVTEQLPNSLLSEVILHENYALIHKVHLFNGVSQGFVNSLVLKMKPELCLPGDRNAARDGGARAVVGSAVSTFTPALHTRTTLLAGR